MIGADRAVSLDRLDDDGQQRHQPCLVALAGDTQRRRAGADIVWRHVQRLGDAQAAAIEQGQHSRIARGDPGFIMHLRLVADDGDGLGVRQRFRQRFRLLRRADRGRTRGIHQAFLFEIAQQRTKTGKIAPERTRAGAILAACGEKTAEIGGPQRLDILDACRAAEMAGEKGQELPGVALIGIQRVGGKPPFLTKHLQPAAALVHQLGVGYDQQLVQWKTP